MHGEATTCGEGLGNVVHLKEEASTLETEVSVCIQQWGFATNLAFALQDELLGRR